MNNITLTAKTFREIEKSLENSKINPLHTKKALEHLKTEHINNNKAFSSNPITVYLGFVKPVYLELDYINNFISISKFTEHHEFETEELAEVVISQGKYIRYMLVIYEENMSK